MTRQDVIDWFISRGYEAWPRDWIMGESVLIVRPDLRETSSTGIVVCPCSVYVVPDGSWAHPTGWRGFMSGPEHLFVELDDLLAWACAALDAESP
jgi:hypothetical protein